MTSSDFNMLNFYHISTSHNFVRKTSNIPAVDAAKRPDYGQRSSQTANDPLVWSAKRRAEWFYCTQNVFRPRQALFEPFFCRVLLSETALLFLSGAAHVFPPLLMITPCDFVSIPIHIFFIPVIRRLEI